MASDRVFGSSSLINSIVPVGAGKFEDSLLFLTSLVGIAANGVACVTALTGFPNTVIFILLTLRFVCSFSDRLPMIIGEESMPRFAVVGKAEGEAAYNLRKCILEAIVFFTADGLQ